MTARAARAPLSRERVLEAAVAIADGEGLKALTMRRLAADLEVEAMSLYYHLPAKEALLDGVVETVLAEVVRAAGDDGAAPAVRPAGGEDAVRPPGGVTAVGPPGGEDAERAVGGEDAAGEDWRGTLRWRFLAARRVMLRHPWAPGLLSSRRAVPPIVYAYYDGIVGTMVAAGFSHRVAHRALHAFGSMTLGFVQEIFNPAETETGAAEEDLAAMAAAVPHIAAMMTAEIHAAGDPTLGWCDSQVEFEFTLDLLLDGLERLRG